MDIESPIHEKPGRFARGCLWFKSLPTKLVAKVISFANKVIKVAKDDPRRVVHSVKMGLALSLISLVYYFRPLYNGFGVSTMWAVLTVVVVFEFTVGATLGKGINRGIATFLAGVLGVGAHHLATLAGKQGEPIILGLFVFLLAATASFSRFFPMVKARYDYGVLIFILTFSLVSVSGYRVEKILELAHQRLSTIILGGCTCIFISIFVCPVWAGEELHNLVALNIDKLADFLEGFGEEYFGQAESEDTVLMCKDDKLFLERYKSVLNSKTAEESFANFAKWEPRHGHFRFRHPWKQYLKIGVVTRQFAYRVEALNTCINSEIQIPQELKKTIQEACTTMSTECGKALKELAAAIRTMTYPYMASLHLANSKAAANNLKITLRTSLPFNTDFLQLVPAATVTSLLVEIVGCTEKLVESVHELAQLAKFKCIEPLAGIPEKPQLVRRVTVKSVSETDVPHVVVTIVEPDVVLQDLMRSSDR